MSLDIVRLLFLDDGTPLELHVAFLDERFICTSILILSILLHMILVVVEGQNRTQPRQGGQGDTH